MICPVHIQHIKFKMEHLQHIKFKMEQGLVYECDFGNLDGKYNHNVAKQLNWFSQCKQEINDLQVETINFMFLFWQKKRWNVMVFNACLYILT
jgi:virulence-associated protein VapD